jgi:hypothetical protein
LRISCSSRLGFKVVLATSLVHLFPPKHHVRALSVIDEVLSQAPSNAAALMGRAYILQHENRWSDAAELFASVSNLLPGDLHLGIRAKEEQAWCQSHTGEPTLGIQGLEGVLAVLTELDDADAKCARCLWRIGKSYWDTGGEQLTVFVVSTDDGQTRSATRPIAISFCRSNAIPRMHLRSHPLGFTTRSSSLPEILLVLPSASKKPSNSMLARATPHGGLQMVLQKNENGIWLKSLPAGLSKAKADSMLD